MDRIKHFVTLPIAIILSTGLLVVGAALIWAPPDVRTAIISGAGFVGTVLAHYYGVRAPTPPNRTRRPPPADEQDPPPPAVGDA